MTTDPSRNKQLAIELWGRADLSADPDPQAPDYPDYFATYYTEDYHNHASEPNTPRGLEGERILRRGFMELFAGAHFEIDKVAADGDLVILTGMFTAKHVGHSLFGIAADGRDVSQEQVHILRFRDGRISDHWAIRDDLAMLRQMEAASRASGSEVSGADASGSETPAGGILNYLQDERK